MSNLKMSTFLAFTFIGSGISIVSGDFFSEELVVVSAERGFYRLTIENATLIGETELIPSISTFVTRPYCSTCGATYNGLLFDNWYFLPGSDGTILGLESTRFNNVTFTSWKLGDCEPLALGVHNASKILYISCATNNNTVGLRVVDFVHGGEPDSVTFKMNSSVNNEYTEPRAHSQNPGIFVEYDRSYHFVSSVGNDLLIHKLDEFLVKHLGTYRAPCSSSISDIAVLEDNASLVTRCGNGEISIFNLHSANFTPINSNLSTEPDSNIQYEILVSYSGSYVAIWTSKEITVFTTSLWVFVTISNPNNSITSLTFIESEGSVLIVYTVADVGVYTYNVTGALIHGIKTVSITLIPGSKSVCSVDGCLGITSVGSLAVVAKISGGLLFYSFSSTSVTTYGPYVTDYNITRVVPSLLSLIDGYNSSTTGTTMTTMPPSVGSFASTLVIIIVYGFFLLLLTVPTVLFCTYVRLCKKKRKKELVRFNFYTSQPMNEHRSQIFQCQIESDENMPDLTEISPSTFGIETPLSQVTSSSDSLTSFYHICRDMVCTLHMESELNEDCKVFNLTQETSYTSPIEIGTSEYSELATHQTSVEESSPQNHQCRAQGSVDHQEQEHDDHHSNQEYLVNAVALEIQGQDSPRLAVGGKDYGEGGRQSPLGANYDDSCSIVPRMNAFLPPPKVGDVLKQAGCFVLGEIQTFTISETGGEWNLYPFPNNKGETCAMLSAPPGVVASGETVVIMYGVIPSGPFVFPEGLELASVLIYLDCNDNENLRKPLSLRLKHFITGDDEVLQNSLCFVKASHTPQDDSFVFKPKSDAVFDSKSGTLEFTDFCLKGICVKKACKEIDKINTRCYAIPCKIQLHPTSRVSYEYRICLVFGLPTWENVFREHYCTRIEYNREIHLPQEVEFKADEPIQSHVNESDMNGNGWQMMKLCDSVEFTELEIALLKFCKMKCERIIGELEVGLIFPHVRYVITSEREPTTETHGLRMVCLTLRGCKPKDACFSIFVREELRRERTPEGAEDGEDSPDPSPAVQQQSPIGGFVPPGTFENRFLDWTPSDAGLLEVIDKIKLGWRKIAIYLGIPLTDVVAFESDQDLGGLKALQQWRDGREGCETPSTWNTLLTVVKDKLGVVVHADLEREVMRHKHWSIRKETRL